MPSLVCVDTAPGLTQAFPCGHANQGVTIGGLKQLSTIPSSNIDGGGSHFKRQDIKTGQKNDIEWKFHLLYYP